MLTSLTLKLPSSLGCDWPFGFKEISFEKLFGDKQLDPATREVGLESIAADIRVLPAYRDFMTFYALSL